MTLAELLEKRAAKLKQMRQIQSAGNLDDEKRAKLNVTPTTLLFNTYGKPWTADGLSSSFYRHRATAMEGDDLPSIHDLRKTAATNMVVTQQRFPDVITDQVLCDMFGWTTGTLAKMKRIYVSDVAVIEAMTSN
ncbi:MAG: hypothetical protein JJ931_04305 [Henriciella sp.]|nr:hypothetical protein [Henriciella sp.]MBO6694623.1 hypothetical protein [Henriciella sp.]